MLQASLDSKTIPKISTTENSPFLKYPFADPTEKPRQLVTLAPGSRCWSCTTWSVTRGSGTTWPPGGLRWWSDSGTWPSTITGQHTPVTRQWRMFVFQRIGSATIPGTADHKTCTASSHYSHYWSPKTIWKIDLQFISGPWLLVCLRGSEWLVQGRGGHPVQARRGGAHGDHEVTPVMSSADNEIILCRLAIRDNETVHLYYGTLPGVMDNKLLCVTHLEWIASANFIENNRLKIN